MVALALKRKKQVVESGQSATEHDAKLALEAAYLAACRPIAPGHLFAPRPPRPIPSADEILVDEDLAYRASRSCDDPESTAMPISVTIAGR